MKIKGPAIVAGLACLSGLAAPAYCTSAIEPAPAIAVDEAVDPVLTLVEAAALLRVDAATVERLAIGQHVPARQVEGQWRFRRLALLQWLAGDWQIQTLVRQGQPTGDATAARADAVAAPASAEVIARAARAAIQGRGTAGGSGVLVRVADQPSEPIGAPPDQPTASEVFLRDQRVLLAPNELTLDVGLFYTRRDAVLLTRLGDTTTLANAESDQFTTQLIARYSLVRNTEVYASTAYSYQQANLYAGAQQLSRATRSEFGAVGLGVRRTIVEEGPGRPDVIMSLDARIPTGHSSTAVGTGVTLVKSLDPVVVFGTLAYRYTRSRDFDDVTRLEPKHRFDLTAGYAFALNDTLSINTTVGGSFLQSTTFRNAELRSSNTANLQLGMTARVARGLYLQPSVSYRLNGPSEGYTLGLNAPITF